MYIRKAFDNFGEVRIYNKKIKRKNYKKKGNRLMSTLLARASSF